MYDLIKESPYFYNVTFYKKVKKRNTGNIEIEPGDTYYGVTKRLAYNLIAHHESYNEDEEISLKDYIKRYLENYNNIHENN